jgi:hypothetical protein
VDPEEPFTVRVALRKGEELGIGIIHDDETRYNMVSDLKQGSAATETTPKIYVGDIIFKVNSTDVTTSSEETAIAVLKEAANNGKGVVHLTLQRPSQGKKERVATPGAQKASAQVQRHGFDRGIIFQCDTPGVTFRYKFESAKKDGTDAEVEFQSTDVCPQGIVQVDVIDYRKEGVYGITVYASRKGWLDSKIYHSSFSLWKASTPTILMRPRKGDKARFHEIPNEVLIQHKAAIESRYVHGCSFIERLEDIDGVRGTFERIKATDAVSSGRFTEVEQAMYVAYKMATTIPGIRQVLLLLDGFRKLPSYSDKTNSVSLGDATALLGVAEHNLSVMANFGRELATLPPTAPNLHIENHAEEDLMEKFKAGSTTATVASNAEFQVGDHVVIGAGTDGEESLIVASISTAGELEFTTGAVNTHAIGVSTSSSSATNLHTASSQTGSNLVSFVAMARCAFLDRNLHSRMPLVPTPARLKRAGV